MGVPAVHRARPDEFRSRRRVQRGRADRSDQSAGWAEAHYIDRMPHNPLGPICTAATVHLAAATPNFAWLEVRTSPTEQLGFDDAELFPVQPRLEGTRFPVPETPGLGVEFNEQLATRRDFRFWEAPHLHRRDGSYTNW